MIIDATDLIVGRLATKAAKAALLGEKVDVINCESAILSGTRQSVLAKYRRKRELGIPLKGPYFPRLPDRFVRRIIRGMLPYKRARGSEAFKRVMCHVGVPVQFRDKKTETFKDANVGKLPTLKYVKVLEICKYLGAK
ncbi:MAG: 50S ribosomal protein L13 [Nanoarchaeota archaeon]|nr:50S ribosomal protein L13 [Nanoarchaeota archaeon]